MTSAVSPRALVVLRVPRGATRPGDAQIREAIQVDRRRLALPATAGVAYELVGPYSIVVGGEALDEYVAWEV
jgi:hypothetical protein